MPEPIFIKLGMYIMAPEFISTAYFINPSLCVCMCILLSLLGNGYFKTLTRQWTHKQQKNCLTSLLYEIRAVSKESRLFVLLRASCYLFKYLTYRNMFPLKCADINAIFNNVPISSTSLFRHVRFELHENGWGGG
jgi:hypothetical protein